MAPDIKPRRRARANARTKRNPPMKIVYHAALEEGSTSLQRLRSFRALDGVEVIAHDSNARMSKAGTLYQRIRWRLGWPTDNFHENERLLAFVAEIRPDVVFVDTCKVIRRSTLRAMRDLGARRLVYYSPDDMMNPMNMKWPLRLSMPEWDVVFTTKSFNVPELRALGARNPREIGNAYDPTLHRSLSAAEVGEEFERFDLVFAGASEAARHRSINALGEAGFSVVIYGGDLGNWDTQKLHPLVECRPAAFGPAYAMAMHHGKLALCFLRKMNRDRITTRSIEIPAMMRPMLAEKTAEHDAHFIDGVEYAGFLDDNGMIAAATRYIRDAEARLALARNGRQRCISSGYSAVDRAREMLSFMR